MYAILCFDTEDVYFPPECGIDDIPGWLAEIMTEAGITGTFFVMGEKAESMKRRGREDVLEKMMRHDLASHQQGNRHPLLPEAVEGKGWRDGLEAMRAYEDWVRDRHVEAFGREPVGFSRHNAYFAPQHIAVAGERGLPYMYMIEQIPGSTQPLWYAGALTFPVIGDNGFGGFDAIYSRDDLFEKRFHELDAYLDERQAEGREWVTLFACHPVQVMARGWFEHYALASGGNRTPAEVGWRYAVKPRSEEKRAKANFRRLCEYLRARDGLDVIGISEAARLFSAQPETITRDSLTAYAQAVNDAENIPFHDTFSPAEMTGALAEAIAHWREHGSLPETVTRAAVLGPETCPIAGIECDLISADELNTLCRQVLGNVQDTGCLPANVQLQDSRVSISQFLLAAARAYIALARRDVYATLQLVSAPRYPEVAHACDAWIRRYIGEHWAMPDGFSCEALTVQTRLQTWSMKPAWLRPPQGPVVTGMKFGPRTQVARD